MKGRAALAAAVMIGLTISSTGASAATPAVQIEDPVGDANFANDQGRSDVYDHDNATGPRGDLSDDADIISVYFTHDRKTVTANVQVEHDPAAQAGAHHRPGFLLEVRAAPREGESAESGCLRWFVVFEPNHLVPPWGAHSSPKMYDACHGGSPASSESAAVVVVRTLPDGSGLVSITGSRAASPLLGRDAVLTSPWAATRTVMGSPGPAESPGYPVADTTVVGDDYVLDELASSRA